MPKTFIIELYPFLRREEETSTKSWQGAGYDLKAPLNRMEIISAQIDIIGLGRKDKLICKIKQIQEHPRIEVVLHNFWQISTHLEPILWLLKSVTFRLDLSGKS